MLEIKERINGNVYLKAKNHDGSRTYKVGDVIWSSIYSHEESRWIRIPMYDVVKVYKAQNLVIRPVNARDYVSNFMA